MSPRKSFPCLKLSFLKFGLKNQKARKLKKRSLPKKNQKDFRFKILFPFSPFSFFFLLISLFLVFLALTIKKSKVPLVKSQKTISGFDELLPTVYPYPYNKQTYFLPELTATSVYVLDANSSVVLYEKNANLPLPPASTTKMMTALVALDYYSKDQILTVQDGEVEGNSVKFFPGEQLTVENLLYALLIASANDAALTLAQNYPGGENAFVEAMNQKSSELGLKNTHFTNPVGYDSEDHYSSAKDLALIAQVLIKNPFLAEIVSLPTATISDITGIHTHFLKNTNELVGKNGVRGIKTGWTQKAKECLVSWVEKNNQKIIIVLLESDNRFGETEKIIDWVFNNFEWRQIIPTPFN